MLILLIMLNWYLIKYAIEGERRIRKYELLRFSSLTNARCISVATFVSGSS